MTVDIVLKFFQVIEKTIIDKVYICLLLGRYEEERRVLFLTHFKWT